MVRYSKDGSISGTEYISGDHEKYCSCVLKVAAKQDPDCILNKNYGKGNCYNPYAVCSKSTHDHVHSCSEYVDYSKMPIGILRAQALLYGIYPQGGRDEILNNIYKYKNINGKINK